jgi:spermidine/putrescine transport system permease protein
VTDRLINIGLKLYIILSFGFIFFPIVALVLFAFNDSRFPSLPWSGFTTEWFEAVFSSADWRDSLKNSLAVAAIVAVIATFLGATAGYFVARWNFRGKGLYLAVAVLPPCIPLIVLGLAFLIYLKDIGLSGTLTSVVISHVVLASAFALGIVRMRLTEMDPTLEEAAWNLGATQWRTIREVVLPQAAPALVASLLIAAAVSWDEFVISWFVSGLDVTLPVRIFNELQGQVSARVNAIGTVVFGVTILLVVLAQLALLVWAKTGGRQVGLVETGAQEDQALAPPERALAREV